MSARGWPTRLLLGALVRLSNQAEKTGGVLRYGMTYPATGELCWVADSAAIYAQWRDVAGNWSAVESLAR